MLYEVITNDTLKAFGELANIYRRKFIIPVIAICGSNGKTSVKDYTAHVLSQNVITSYSIHYTKLYEIFVVEESGEKWRGKFQPFRNNFV